MTPSFELFDHTADIGIRAFAPTLARLVAPAAQGLYAVIGELVPQEVAASEVRRERLTFAASEESKEDAALRLRDYLAELLLWFDRDRRIAVEHTVREFRPDCLVVEVRLCPVDEDRSACVREVKAVTYHELAVREIPGGFEALIILDI